MIKIMRGLSLLVSHLHTMGRTKKSKNHLVPDRLDQVAATMLDELGVMGVFHYNKLLYLFEYFFIRNFGERYTGEQFIKLPHGPAVSTYKNSIVRLADAGLVAVDVVELMRKREVDDDANILIPLDRTSATSAGALRDPFATELAVQVAAKYGRLSVGELERAVYRTDPVKRFLEVADAGWGVRRTGGYILCSNCIRIRETLEDPIVRGRQLAMRHAEKFPDADWEQQKHLAEEWAFLNELRPTP